MRRARPALLLTSLFLSALALAAGPARAETVTLDKPIRIDARKADKSKVSGRVVAYDEEGFELKVKGDETETIPWADLDAQGTYIVRKALVAPKKDATEFVELGRILLPLKDGAKWADKAFADALKLDPGFKGQVAQLKADAKAGVLPAVVKKPGEPEEPGELMRGEGEPADPEAGGEAAAGAKGNVGPKKVGGIQDQFWGEQTEEQQAASVAELKQFAAKTQEAMGKEFRLNETKYFLFYSELAPKEAKNWAGVLDRMYGKLAEMFGVDPGLNIMRGKALVFVFLSRDDYVRFQRQMHNTDAGSSDGMCHTYGNGYVHIAFYRQPDEIKFAHVLVHESVHGFIHRYKTPHDVPVWANEGLAEWIATQLVPRTGGAKQIYANTKMVLQRFGGAGGLLEARGLQGWQYPVAEMLTTFMIERNRKGYVAFVKAMKDGAEWKAALAEHYKLTPDQLMDEFGRAIGVRLAN
jgi:hypothetical protein